MRGISGKSALAIGALLVFATSAVAAPQSTSASANPKLLSVKLSDVDVTPKPTPIGNPGDWFPADAYPQAARDEGVEGRTVFALDVDAKGGVAGCSIVTSSGSELLDTTTCTLLKANAHFKPALGKKKKPVPSVWRSAMRWKLVAPEPASAPAPAPQ